MNSHVNEILLENAKDSIVGKYAKKCVENFKVTKKTSLANMLELGYVYYANHQEDNLEICTNYLIESLSEISISNQWCPMYLASLMARVKREKGNIDEAKKYVEVINKIGFNETIVTRGWIEREHQWAYTRMTVRAEEEWRINMLYLLCLVIETGGSPTLSADDAEHEFKEHLQHLRSILGVPQNNPPARPQGKEGPFPIKSFLFEDYKKLKSVLPLSSNDKKVALEVSANENGWVLCPTCERKFKATDKNAYDGTKHLKCKQKLKVV